MSMMLLGLLATAAQAAPCDARALEREVTNASPAAMADAFVKLAQCDARRAKKAAGTHMRRMVADQDAIPAVLEALRIGAGAEVRAWIAEEVPDVQSRLVSRLGAACADAPELVGPFFEAAHADMGEAFWDQRWYRGLDACRTPAVQALLTEALDSDVVGRGARNKQQFNGVVSVWARNLGVGAIPTLKSFLAEPRDAEEAMLLVSKFSDVAQVGSTAGVDAEAAAAAVAAIVDLAPSLPLPALARARDTLVVLGEPDTGAGLARWAWQDRYTDGQYTYGVALIEDATCKNGKRRGAVHLGSLTEPGAQWPETFEASLEERLKAAYAPQVGAKCKGTSTFAVRFSREPVTAEGLAAWHGEVEQDFRDELQGAQKTWTFRADPVAF